MSPQLLVFIYLKRGEGGFAIYSFADVFLVWYTQAKERLRF